VTRTAHRTGSELDGCMSQAAARSLIRPEPRHRRALSHRVARYRRRANLRARAYARRHSRREVRMAPPTPAFVDLKAAAFGPITGLMHTKSVRPVFVRAASLVALAVSLHYLVWRALHSLNADAPVLSLLLYAAECYGFVMLVMHVVMTWDTRSLERRLGLASDQRLEQAVFAPPADRTVDVFIPTYDESVALLRKTVLAARELRRPHDTWVLDDGRRAEVREMCADLGVGYLTRESNEHAKAGNLNAALARTSGEFIVVLDADFIALPALLERTLPHFDDEGLAFVQLPQAFYNIDSIQHIDGDVRTGWHEQSLFYDVIQPGKNRWNSAFWCGSPAVLRRKALASVGGAATTTITEDILTSMRMHAAGWRSLYHNEILAVGVAPGDLDAFRTQRLRWAQGSMQILRSRENPLWKRGLSFAQRLSYFASMATYFQAVQLAIFAAMPPVMLLTGQAPMSNLGGSFLGAFIPYMVATALATKLTGGARQRLLWDQYFAFLRMFTFLRAMGTLATGGRKLRFRVTPKAPCAVPQRRGLYPHVAAAALNVAALGTLLVPPLRQHFDTGTTTALYACAALVASLFAMTAFRLWRRIYRRHHYRSRVALPVSVAIDGDPRTRGETEDVSFGGASLAVPRRVKVHTRVTVGILGREPITIEGTVMTCARTGADAYRIGVRFERLDVEDEKRLLFLLLDHALDAPPDSARHTGASRAADVTLAPAAV
jgi:cellulose synthase (UDP-forming)